MTARSSETTATPDRVEAGTSERLISHREVKEIISRYIAQRETADAASPPPVPEELRKLWEQREKARADWEAVKDDWAASIVLEDFDRDIDAELIQWGRSLLRSPPEPVASDSLSQSAERETQASADSERKWRAAPVEITQEMMGAGRQYLDGCVKLIRPDGFGLPATFRWVEFWEALLAAAPEPATLAVEAVNAVPELKAEVEAMRAALKEIVGKELLNWGDLSDETAEVLTNAANHATLDAHRKHKEAGRCT